MKTVQRTSPNWLKEQVAMQEWRACMYVPYTDGWNQEVSRSGQGAVNLLLLLSMTVGRWFHLFC